MLQKCWPSKTKNEDPRIAQGIAAKDILQIVGSTPPPVPQYAHGSEAVDAQPDPLGQFEFGAKPQPRPRPVARGCQLHHDGHGGTAGGQGQGGQAAETVSWGAAAIGFKFKFEFRAKGTFREGSLRLRQQQLGRRQERAEEAGERQPRGGTEGVQAGPQGQHGH